MKCPKCNGDKGQWDIGNYHWYPCDSCHETGEVEDLCPTCLGTKKVNTIEPNKGVVDCPTCVSHTDMDKPINSRSVQRREALQKGETMPTFDKPEMPNQITNEFGELNAKFIQEAERMMYRCKELQSYLDYANSHIKLQLEEYDKLKANSLPADKVRELVRLHEEFRDLLLKHRFTPGIPYELTAKAEEIDNLQSALFPEGVDDKEDK